MVIYRGTIRSFRGSWGSGLGFLELEDGKSVSCDNALTVRALDAAFDGVIADGHRVDNQALAGKEIVYWYDDLGLVLGGFMPADDYVGEDIPEDGLRSEFTEDLFRETV